MPADSISLTARVTRLIDDTRLVDPHTHLRLDQPSAPDLASLMGYHWVQTELKSVGMPEDAMSAEKHPTERVRNALPFLAAMRNTAMSWCLHRMLHDLYDFADDRIDPGNCEALCERVAAAHQRPGWTREVLTQKARVDLFVTSLGNRSRGADPAAAEAELGAVTRYMLDAHYLFCPGVATDLDPFFTGRHTKGEYHAALTQIFQAEPRDCAHLAALTGAWLDKVVTGQVRFTNTFLPIEKRFSKPDEAAVSRLLARTAGGVALGDAEVDVLANAVAWNVLAWHHENRKAFQIAVGAEYFICGGKSIPRFEANWSSEMARLFHTFPGARFDLMMASAPLSQEMCVLARQFPNVSLAGHWWHNFFPDLITREASLRLQVTPMIKITAFLCDAYWVEWTYGKLQVIRRGLAKALAGLVEDGFLREDALPEILTQILNQTPRTIYELD